MNYTPIKENAKSVYEAPCSMSVELSNGEVICAGSKPSEGSLEGYTPEVFPW